MRIPTGRTLIGSLLVAGLNLYVTGIATAGEYTFTSFDVPFTGATGTIASAINDRGQIAGMYFDATGSHIFVDSGGSFSSLNLPFAGVIPFTVSVAAMTNSGTIVGGYSDATGSHGYVESGGKFTSIDVPFSGATSTGIGGINQQGQIVGSYSDATGQHGFVDTRGSFISFDVPFAGVTSTSGIDINDRGQIIGVYFDATGQHLFVESGGSFSSFVLPFPNMAPTSFAASSINNRGEIVGFYTGPPTTALVHGYLFSSGSFSLFDVPFAGAGRTHPFSINDSGVVLGDWVGTTGTHGFFAIDPPNAIPEPATILLLSSGLVGLAGWRFVRRHDLDLRHRSP